MAIPFNVQDDSDYEEALLQQLFSDLYQILQRIAVIQRSRTQNTNLSRVYTSSTSNRRSRDHGDTTTSQSEQTLLNSAVNLAFSLSPAGSQSELEALLQPENSPIPLRRLYRRRSRSEPSYCEEIKPVKVSVSVEVTNKNWIQHEKCPESTTKKRWCGSESLLSKLVPVPISGPLWTAVICMVGWHLLRTR